MSAPASRLRRTCDIVMKGGITSGVVYPQAITTLAERYDFKNIGGTSAGAIAAAAAAAAQYRRVFLRSEDGFLHFAKLPDMLASKPDGAPHTRLFYLFQPGANTRHIFEVLTGALGGGTGAPWNMLRRLTEQYPGWTIIGLMPGLCLAIWSAMNFAGGPIAGVWILTGVLLLFAGGALGAGAAFVRDFIREVPGNGYGLCSGAADSGSPGIPPQPDPLTPWLTRYLNEIAGLPLDGDPLTFGQLWGTHESDPVKAARAVNLEMMTTNLTHGRPYRLPLRDDDDLRENHRFYFRAEEFRRLFPERVVQWMIDHPRDTGGDARREARRERLAKAGFFSLPDPADLPVVVATRMSLSFPILLSAVPLHAIDRAVFHDNELPERCWFSDGGICSNFPLHFFDGTLPRRPTFSIDLSEKPAGTPKDQLTPAMPESNNVDINDRWNRFDTDAPAQTNTPPADKPDLDRLIGFVWSIIATMQNWSDTTQARLPGYRDRIVTVPLTPDEGGLNLDMPPENITALTERGVMAAELIKKHFDVPPSDDEVMTWDNHRWIRLRSFLASLEKLLNQLATANDQPESGDRGYDRWLADLATTTGPDAEKAPSYQMTKKHIKATRDTLAALRSIRGFWDGTLPSDEAPRPRPVLRPRPQI